MEAFTEADILVIRVASVMGHIDALSIRNVLLILLRMHVDAAATLVTTYPAQASSSDR